MSRVLFFVLLGIGLYIAYRVWRGGKRGDGAATTRRPAASEAMVRCSHCGLNVPQSEALANGPRWYCSEAHRRLGQEGG